MKQPFFDAITTHYGLKNISVRAAPRQFVAETYVIKTGSETYFCKIVDKPLFIPKIMRSLPVLDAMHHLGFERVNFPLKTVTDALYVMVDDVLIVLFNYIDAPQSYEFDDAAFGRLMGSIHALTPQITVPLPEEDFSPDQPRLMEQFEEILAEKSSDEVMQRLQKLIRQRETQLRKHDAALQKLTQVYTGSQVDKVITHGDAGGNVLVKAPDDLYIIDWDEILRAPAERDLWIHDQRPEFMTGYRSVIPEYRTNDLARSTWICKQHFDYMRYYLAEITGDFPTEYRHKIVGEFEDYFEGWIKPFLAGIA